MERKASSKFERIGLPSETNDEGLQQRRHQTIGLCAPTAAGHFKHSAETLTEEKGAVETLAAALSPQIRGHIGRPVLPDPLPSSL